MSIAVSGLATASGQNVTDVTTAGRTTAAGCVLVAVIAQYNSGGDSCTMSDSKGNTWNPCAALVTVNGALHGYRVFYCVPTTVGAGHTFTATRGSANYTDIDLTIIELASGDTASAFDSAALSAASGGTSTNPTNTTNALAVADSIVIGVVTIFANATLTGDAAFDDRAYIDVGSDHVQLMVETKVVSATSPVTYAPSIDTSQTWGCRGFTFKGAAAAGIIGPLASRDHLGGRGPLIAGRLAA